jgi:hypothetical protein
MKDEKNKLLILQGAAAAIFGLSCPYNGNTASRRIWFTGYEKGQLPEIAKPVRDYLIEVLKL